MHDAESYGSGSEIAGVRQQRLHFQAKQAGMLIEFHFWRFYDLQVQIRSHYAGRIAFALSGNVHNKMRNVCGITDNLHGRNRLHNRLRLKYDTKNARFVRTYIEGKAYGVEMKGRRCDPGRDG